MWPRFCCKLSFSSWELELSLDFGEKLGDGALVSLGVLSGGNMAVECVNFHEVRAAIKLVRECVVKHFVLGADDDAGLRGGAKRRVAVVHPEKLVHQEREGCAVAHVGGEEREDGYPTHEVSDCDEQG